MAEFTLRIDGMHCGACIRRVTQALTAAQGVQVQEVRLGEARLSATQAPAGGIEAPAPVELAIAALAKAGYSAQLEP
jgi:copper chaperone CopZ